MHAMSSSGGLSTDRKVAKSTIKAVLQYIVKEDEQVVGMEANLLIHVSAGVLRKVHLCQVDRSQLTLSSSGYILLRKDAKV